MKNGWTSGRQRRSSWLRDGATVKRFLSTAPQRTAGPKRDLTSTKSEMMPRIGYSVAEAAHALGMNAPALRAQIQRHAVREGDEWVSRLTGMTARKRDGAGRWLVVIDAALIDGAR